MASRDTRRNSTGITMGWPASELQRKHAGYSRPPLAGVVRASWPAVGHDARATGWAPACAVMGLGGQAANRPAHHGAPRPAPRFAPLRRRGHAHPQLDRRPAVTRPPCGRRAGHAARRHQLTSSSTTYRTCTTSLPHPVGSPPGRLPYTATPHKAPAISGGGRSWRSVTDCPSACWRP